jgi:hypothetical protein
LFYLKWLSVLSQTFLLLVKCLCEIKAIKIFLAFFFVKDSIATSTQYKINSALYIFAIQFERSCITLSKKEKKFILFSLILNSFRLQNKFYGYPGCTVSHTMDNDGCSLAYGSHRSIKNY